MKVIFGRCFKWKWLIVEISESISAKSSECVIIDAEGNYLMPGADDQVISGSQAYLQRRHRIWIRAAVAGGITSFIEQPNTVPNATQEILEEKYQVAAEKSYELFVYDGSDQW
jgi:dihydroorotase